MEVQNLNNDTIEYSKYRDISRKLNHKMLTYLHTTQKPGEDLKLLKVLKGKDAYLNKNVEKDFCYDFIINEKTFNNQSGIDLYIKNNETTNDELKLINAMRDSYTALYRARDINDEKSTVLLEEVDTGKMVNIIDIGFSKTLNNQCLVFTRIIKLENINFTSGMSMVFDINHEEFLKRVLKKEMKKSNLDKDVQKFISYFHLSRKHGYDLALIKTT